MGRVKRYKKLKACDPCAPKRKAEGEEKYDLPPMDSDDEGPGRKRRRQEKKWERDALRDDEYVEQLEEKAKRRKKLPEVNIQPRQPNESMKAFQHRVRQESRELLRASNVANSATQQRRREFLRQRKKDKKLKRRKENGLLTYEEVEEHLAEQREREVFGRDWHVGFGETNDAPPDLRGLKLPRLPGGKAKATPRLVKEEGGGERAVQKRKAAAAAAAAAAAKNKKKAPQPARTTAEKEEWARLREEAQAAYRAMRAKQGQGPRLYVGEGERAVVVSRESRKRRKGKNEK